MTPQVSVVVPTFKRPALLRRCLDALVAQDFDPAAYEVIVVDDAPTSETAALVADCAQRAVPTLRYLPAVDSHGPAAARNLGWRAARGAIVAFTDDDCVPTPHWLRAGVAAFVDGVAGAAGRVWVPLPPTPTDYERNAVALEHGEFVTANCFYRRDALATVGGFDERFTAPFREDTDLFMTLLEHGVRLVHTREAVVVHPIRPAAWGVSLVQQRRSVFNALLYKKHPALYRQRIQPAPPWRYYGIVGALLAAGGGALAGQRWLALGAGAAWLFMTGRFCAERLDRTSRAPGHVAEMMVTSALIPPLAVYWRLRGALRYRVWFL